MERPYCASPYVIKLNACHFLCCSNVNFYLFEELKQKSVETNEICLCMTDFLVTANTSSSTAKHSTNGRKKKILELKALDVYVERQL